MQAPQKILEFKIDREIFGVDADLVEQIIKIPPITPVPLSSGALLGVNVLSGKVINILDTSELLNVAKVDTKKEEARALTIKVDEEVEAFCVDEVLLMRDIKSSNLELSEDEDSIIMGFYKTDEYVTQIISIDNLLKNVSLDRFTPLDIANVNSDDKKQSSSGSDDKTIRALFFKIQDERYALNLEILRELIFAPSEITPIAGSDAMGMITLRDEVMSVLDLNALFGFASKEADEKSRCLIVKYSDKSVALLVDEVEEVKDILLSQIESMPEGFNSEFIEAIYKSEEDVVSIVSLSYLRELIKGYHIQEEKDTSQDIKSKDTDMAEVAVFSLQDEEYAFSIDEVQEIIRYEDVTPVPDAPEFVEGILNLRGSVIAVVSLPKRLGFSQNITDKTKILVCNIQDEKVGFIVDEVDEILFVESKFISKAKNEESVFDEVISLDGGKRVVLKLQVKNLFDEEFLKAIGMVTRG